LEVFQLNRTPNASFRADVNGANPAVRELVRILEDSFALVLLDPQTHGVIDQSKELESPRFRKADKAGNDGDND